MAERNLDVPGYELGCANASIFSKNMTQMDFAANYAGGRN